MLENVRIGENEHLILSQGRNERPRILESVARTFSMARWYVGAALTKNVRA